MKALLIVDLQNDFCPGGALAVRDGDEIVPVINKLVSRFDIVLASKDWHPRNSKHFKQWPTHCVQESRGADFHPELDTSKISYVFLKGSTSESDGYTVFEAENKDFEEYLKENEVDELYFAGLATDYCVLYSAVDAANKGYRTVVIKDAVKAVNKNKGDEDMAFSRMIDAGCTLLNSEEIRN